MTALREATYSSSVFNVTDVEQAKKIILTTEGQLTTEERWRTETPYLLSLIEEQVKLDEDSVVLDYGCGIGRLSKALIERYDCWVVGVDISPSMRALAASYVSSPKFSALAPEFFDCGAFDPKFDLALAVWTLQHCYDVEADVARISGSLIRGGKLFVVNDRKRLVPTRQCGWVNDGKDILRVLDDDVLLDGGSVGELDPRGVGDLIASVSFWGTWRRNIEAEMRQQKRRRGGC